MGLGFSGIRLSLSFNVGVVVFLGFSGAGFVCMFRKVSINIHLVHCDVISKKFTVNISL